MTAPGGIVFDLDGTLVNSEAAYGAALRSVGIDPTDAAYQAARRTIKTRLGAGHVGARNRLLYFKELSATQPMGAASLLSLMEAYERHLEEVLAQQWDALGRQPLLQALRRRAPCVILTNENTRTQLIKWRAIDPHAELFVDLISSEEMGCEKPDPRMFEAACRRLGLPPEACLMVGDSYDCDIAPAETLGMQAVLSLEFAAQGTASPLPCRTLSRLNELEDHL